MKLLFDVLNNNQAKLLVDKGYGEIIHSSINDEALLIASSFTSNPRTIVVVKSSLYEAQQLHLHLSSMIKESSLYFPYDESLRVEALAASPEMQAIRFNTISRIIDKKPIVLVTHTAAIIRKIPSYELFVKKIIDLKVDQVIDPKILRRKLVELGYNFETRVDTPFHFSNRGGIIDVFSMNYENPVRIEFFDDIIESIRFYDPESQRTLKSVDEVSIYPASEILYDDEDIEEVVIKITNLKEQTLSKISTDKQDILINEIAMDIENIRNHGTSFHEYRYYGMFNKCSSILDYFNNPVVILSDKNGVLDNYKMLMEEGNEYNLELFEAGKMLPNLDLFFDIHQVLSIHKKQLLMKMFRTKDSEVTFNTRSLITNVTNEETLVKLLREYIETSKVLIILEKDSHIRKLEELFVNYNLKYVLVGDEDKVFDGINIYRKDMAEGLELMDENLIILTAKELFGLTQRTPKHFLRYKNAKVIKNYEELNIGDYVVHDMHGIGQYMGIKTLETKGNLRDYLYIAYKDNDTLYVPVEQFKLIRKYSSKDGRPPKIYKLGSTAWQKTKQKIREKVDDLADYLIDLYAKRMAMQGYAFGQDTPEQIGFENDFEFDLTIDQITSLQEIKEDMEKPQPMDRLLCGDVGFGKTEVALRAAFKAIMEGKQVALLCPTTILSKQHYETMVHRFRNYPVNIAMLNRYVTPKDASKILNDLKEGKIDILVGTHRILSKDVKFKNIGFLIVDEEQRFGVKHKETIKEFKQNIDVLTLTATPIPRTLQMSLMGIRGLSQIDTPPKNRMPVNTYVVEKNPAMIKQIIERELARGGQVFYLYNNTSDITSQAYKITRQIPNARVGIGHGKMDKEELEDVMMKFVNRDYNVLVCTTIIETGIDIPNANTIIIEDADHFGLSQLYQIKGRVGRSDRMAYAYLMYRPHRQLTEIAMKRLSAIKEFTELGSGYKIAMRDLAIRGAGDILGGEQAGFIDTVGFDMYMKILQEAIQEKTGQLEEDPIKVSNVSVEGYIPQNYVSTDMEKLQLYQRIDHASSLIDIDEIQSEIIDIYGKLPREVAALIDKRRFDILISITNVEKINDQKDFIEITFNQEYTNTVDGVKLLDLVYSISREITVRHARGFITFKMNKTESWMKKLNELLERI